MVSADGRYIASLDLDREELVIAPVTGGAPRTFKPASAPRWIARDVVEISTPTGAMLVAVDPTIAPRAKPADLVGDPRSRYGVRRDRGDIVVERVADGVEVARHGVAAGATVAMMRPLPDDSGAIVIEWSTGGPATREVITRSKARVTLAPSRHFRLGTLAVADQHLISRTDDSVAVWDLTTGRSLAIPVGARDAIVADGELWAIAGGRKPRAMRIRLDGKSTQEIRLSTAGLPFQHATNRLALSADRKRLTSAYALADELSALATWDVETGALLWVGPATAHIVGDWRAVGGRVVVPVFEIEAVLRDAGTRTNLRVCKTDYRAVAISPPPPPDMYWAPESACTTGAR
jgi:hypothetical protein